MKNATQRLIAAAKKVAANPNDPEALRELNEAHKYLLDKLNEVRRDAGLTPGAGMILKSLFHFSFLK